MTTIKLYGGDLGNEIMLVRCNLAEASAPVQVDYCNDKPGENWEATQYQCANCNHRNSGLADIGMVLAAEAVGMRCEDFSCEWEEIDAIALDPAISEMADMLTRHGDTYAGTNQYDTAEEWIEAGFDTAEAEKWVEAGWWDAELAAMARAMGLTAEETAERAKRLIEDAGEENPYTDGDPIYSICNNDTSINVLLDVDNK